MLQQVTTKVQPRLTAQVNCVHFGALFSGQRSFGFLRCDTRMYLRFRGCLVVLDIELSVSTWYHKTRRVLLRAGRLLLLLLLLTTESKERRLAVFGIKFKPASNGAETKYRFRANQNTRKIRRTQNTPA